MKQTKKNTQKKHTTHTNILVHDLCGLYVFFVCLNDN